MPSWFTSFFLAAYGEFKDDTIAVANKRNQQLVNWDFEYATSLLWTILKNLRFVSECSSGDSTGVKPEDQKVLYDKVIKKRPSTILSLEHEVFSMFFYVCQRDFFWLNVFYVVFRDNRVNPFSLFFFWVVVWYDFFFDFFF